MLTIYKASAGSGKTYTLAFEYVRLLLGVKDEQGVYHLNLPKYIGGHRLSSRHRHILAITFTNKATEEMKSRIIQELGLLAADHSDGSDDCDYVPRLIDEFGCTREDLRQAADDALKSLLFDYHHFNVSTIDSFFQTVLRAFAREVDRQGDYGIELSDEYAVTAGIGLMLDDLNYGNPPQKQRILNWIKNYTLDIVEKGNDASMFNRNGTLLKGLAKYVKKMGSEVFKQRSDAVLAYLDDQQLMTSFIKAIDNRIATIKASLSTRIATLKADLNALGYQREVIPSPVWGICEAVDNDKKINISDKFSGAKIAAILNWSVNGDNSFYVKKYINQTQGFPPDYFTDQLANLVTDCRSSLAEIHGLKKFKDACPNLEFLGYAWHYINRFREENNLILLSDTHDLLDRIIAGSETPFVYEKIGVTLQHFLIDEFQDTSHLQWKNLKPLVANSLALDSDNLIIGDEKQAIYRFRNSDSSLLHHVVANQDFPDNHTLKGSKPGENTNYRSSAGIVMFNNTLFSRIAADCGVEGYENTIQGISKNSDAYISICDSSQLPQVNGFPAELDITAKEILRQHDAGYRWADIAVLVRTHDQAEAVVSYLLKYYPQISVLSDEALMLKNSQAVKLVVSMLKLIDQSYSASASGIGGDSNGKPVYASFGDIRLMISRFDFYRSSGYDTAEAMKLALQPADGSETLAQSITDIRASHPSGLISLIETIIATKISESRRKKEYAYLAAFQDEVIKYCSLYNPSVHAFLDWWNEASQHLAISSGAGQNAISVMTIHKSKGLQWACVHVPFGDWDLVRSGDNVWIAPDMLDFVNDACRPPLISVNLDNTCLIEGSPLREVAEQNRYEQLVDNLNATYVAYTRPERELFICFSSVKEVGAKVFAALNSPLVATADPKLCMQLNDYVCKGEAPEPGIYFRYGTPTVPKKTETDTQATDTQMSDYRVFFRDDTSSLTTIDDATADLGMLLDNESLSDADSDNDSTTSADGRLMAAERGTLLHSIMADIDLPDDLDRAVTRAAERFGLDQAATDEYYNLISHAFENASDHISRWFDPEAKILKEQSIYLPEGDSTFRPDRIIISPDGKAEIVDYKFTSEPLDSHVEQVKIYVRLMRAMGYTDAIGWLWYPELNIVKHIKL